MLLMLGRHFLCALAALGALVASPSFAGPWPSFGNNNDYTNKQTEIWSPACNPTGSPPGGIVGQTYGGAPCALPAGSAGTDYSSNTPALPNVGSNFGGSGPYANYVLLKTVPASSSGCIHVEDDSGTQIALVLDDGTASSGSAPNNASVFALGGGAGAGSQGGSTGPEFCNFKGRVQVYAPLSSAQVFAARW